MQIFLLGQRPPSVPAPKTDWGLLWKHDLALERAFAAAGGLLIVGPAQKAAGASTSSPLCLS
jgi:hypothetical protein